MSLTIEFLGAFDSVTGSRTLVTYRHQSWLIDCGQFQGNQAMRQRNREPFEPSPASLTGVILTHAHVDHTGYLGCLCKQGFNGKIHATEGTVDLTRILLLDAAHLEEDFAARSNDSGKSSHKPATPLFTTEDAEFALRKLSPASRNTWIPLANGLSLRFTRSGHIIGSSFVELACETDDGPFTVVFSGDLGNGRSHLLRGPDVIHGADLLVMESTYGDRLQPRTDSLKHLAEVVNRTYARGGVLVIPAFAVGRAQELTYMLRLLEDAKAIPIAPVILDSPMAASAMGICLRHAEDHILDPQTDNDGEALKPAQFDVTGSPDESMLACMRDGPMTVISASGMLNGGRILQHLKARLPSPKNTVLFCGYQAAGSKGRYLQENSAPLATLRIYHQEVPIAAEMLTLEALSSHGDYQDIIDWIARMDKAPPDILLNHGEPAVQLDLAKRLRDRFGSRVTPSCERRKYTFADGKRVRSR